MEKPFLRTKLHRPPITADTVCRQRLHLVMDRALDLPLTLVSAPAGYGKSMLVSHWAESLEVPCAWLSLDAEDSDLGVFVRYFLAAAQTAVPDALPETQILSETPSLVPLPILAGCLANELDAVDEIFVLVIDDYHRIEPSSEVHELLRALLEHPPRNLRLVISTRIDPPLMIHALRGRGRIAEIRLQDLRFTVSECCEYVERSSDLSVSGEALTNLELQTEGWIVALRLVSLHLRQIDDPEAFLRRMHGGVQQTREYLLLEVLDRLPAWTRDWMLKTAVLDRFCPELCDVVCASEADAGSLDFDGFKLVEVLSARNLFIIPLDAQGRWFRYHHLFQEMLLEQLETRSTPPEISTLHLRASEWFEKDGHIGEAIKHALAAEDIDLAVQIVARHRHPTLSADRWYALENWLSLMPAGVVQQHGELMMAQAWTLIHHFRFEALFPLLDQLESILTDDPANDSIRGEISFCRGYVLFFLGEGQSSLKYITEAQKKIPVSYYEARAQTEIIFALSNQMVGQKQQAVRGLDELLAVYDSPEELRKTRLLITYTFIYIIDGDLMAADLANRRLREVVERGDYAYVRAWTDHLQGVVHLQRGEWDEAVDCLGRSVAKRFIHFKRAATDSIAGLMLAHQARGSHDEADNTLEVLREYVTSLDDPTLWPMVNSAEARLSLIQGKSEPATLWFDPEALPPEGAMLWWLDVPGVTYCRALIGEGSTGSLAEAKTRLHQLFELNEGHHNSFQMVSILTLLAVVFEKRGKTDEALATLERALKLAQPGGLVMPFLELGSPMRALLERLPRETTTGPFFKKMLLSGAAFGFSEGDEPPKSYQSPPDLLTNREQEILELLIQRLQNKEIAARLFISPQTVNSHLKNVFQKLQVSNRRQAVERARELGLLPTD